jgi:hypothetical protein
MTSLSAAWPRALRFGFRFVFSYFAMFGVATLFDVGERPRAIAAAISTPLVRLVGRVVLGLTDAPNAGVRWAIAQQLSAFLVALAIATVWTFASRRTEYRRLFGWMHLVLRYYVAVIMLIYGMVKVVDTQFPPPTLETLSQPFGALTPMGLLWAFMGYSVPYATFGGLGEAVGAVLLFFRRTTTLGALIIAGVMTNVALLNYAYDVPVKQLSFNLVFAAAILAAPDARRLFHALVLNHATQPRDQSFELPGWLVRIRRFVKPVIVVVAIAAPLTASTMLRLRQFKRPPMYGIYEVTRFTRNGATLPPLLTSATQWRRVFFSRPRTMSIGLMNDSLRMFEANLDTVAHRITLRESPRSGARRDTISYEPLRGDTLRMFGVLGNDTLDVSLRRVDHRKAFRLLRGR